MSDHSWSAIFSVIVYLIIRLFVVDSPFLKLQLLYISFIPTFIFVLNRMLSALYWIFQPYFFCPPSMTMDLRFICTFGFHGVNFPFMSSNIWFVPAHGVYVSHLFCYAHCCSNYSDFSSRHRALVTRLLTQGYKTDRLSNTFKVQMKCFFTAEFERAARIRKFAVYCFLISLLVLEL